MAQTLRVAEPPLAYRFNSPLVVDSSVLCALLFEEPEAAQAQALLTGKQLHAPRLLDHEFLSVCLKKQRRGLSAALAELVLGDYLAQQIEMHNTDLTAQLQLAQQYQLSAYDAAYLWLAAELRAPLATFDEQLARAASSHFGSLA